MMTKNTIKRIFSETGGERLDVFLASSIEGLSRSSATKLIETGQVTITGQGGSKEKALRKNSQVTPGATYLVTLSLPEELNAKPQKIALDIVYEDDDLIVVNKAQGMVVHPAPGHSEGTLVNALLAHCGDSLSGIGGTKRPGIVHRLDKMTSGLIIAAKNDRTHISLAAQLSTKTLLREYETIVTGRIKNEKGTVSAPIGRHPVDRKRQAVTEKNSKHAVTHYELLCVNEGYSHLRCRLETGRTHQIRVHMAFIGHPILGDPVYGGKKGRPGSDAQVLHAKRLRFIHPTSAEDVDLRSELPEYFVNQLERLSLIEKGRYHEESS